MSPLPGDRTNVRRANKVAEPALLAKSPSGAIRPALGNASQNFPVLKVEQEVWSRTWHGIVLAALALQEIQKFHTQAGAKKNIKEAIQRVAARLGNTPTICRKCYVHPEIITTYIEGSLLLEVEERAELRDDLAGLKPEEVDLRPGDDGRLAINRKSRLLRTSRCPMRDRIARRSSHSKEMLTLASHILDVSPNPDRLRTAFVQIQLTGLKRPQELADYPIR